MDAYPVMLGEYLGSIVKPESRRAFGNACQAQGLTGRKLPAEWAELFKSFKTAPADKPWVAMATTTETPAPVKRRK